MPRTPSGMPLSFNGRARRPPQPPAPAAQNVELDGFGNPLPPPERIVDDEPEGSVVVEGEETAWDEADALAEMSDADFMAMLEREKAEFVPPPKVEPAPWDRPPQPRKKRNSRPRYSVNFLRSNQLRVR